MTDDAHARVDFEAFVRANWSTLMSIASAVTNSRTEAEDLVQTALTSTWTRWPRICPDRALAYLRRSILNANVSHWRRHRGSEILFAEPPDPGGSASAGTRRSPLDDVDDRSGLVVLLGRLPTRQRAVLVLRYLCDLPDEIAQTLGVSVSTVRSQAFRGLAALRSLSVPELTEEVTS